MKNTNYIKIVTLSILFSMAVTSCKQDFPNVNNPNEELVLNSKDGLFALSVGITQYYTTTVLRQVIEAPGITTRELGVTNTFLNINELARGGNELPKESGGITNPWVTLLRAKGMTESLLVSIDQVDLSAETRSSLIAFGSFYKAITLGGLLHMFEPVPIDNAADGQAQFSDRATVLAACINLLETGRDELNTNPVSAEFISNVLGTDMDLANSINAFLSRYNLMAGNYPAARTAADAVLNSTGQATSYFAYDANNNNPIWNRTVNSADLNPQTNFGLVAPYLPEPGDGRVAFYLGADAGFANGDAGGQPLSEMLGFFSSSTSSIPVYLYGEMLLNKAEAFARESDLPNAVMQLDLVRTKTTDPYGVNANLVDWVTFGGDPNDQAAILEEIYKNRGIEMFLSGMRLEDSRRFHSGLLSVPNPPNTTNERNRNYYPYPTIETDNNNSVPAEPAL
jgi:starch-binding outer membrane protein, SusD/RagB family